MLKSIQWIQNFGLKAGKLEKFSKTIVSIRNVQEIYNLDFKAICKVKQQKRKIIISYFNNTQE